VFLIRVRSAKNDMTTVKQILRLIRYELDPPHNVPPTGRVRYGALRRLEPLDPDFGFGRGMSIARFYIYEFLRQHAADVKGHVLEVGDEKCTKMFGGHKVTKNDILHVSPESKQATIVADLSGPTADSIPSNSFDCVIFTQTLQFIYDMKTAVKSIHRILKPGGVLLMTGNGISQISTYDDARWGEYWRFTSRSLSRLSNEFFDSEKVRVYTYGNVLVTACYLFGVSATELRSSELAYHDNRYQLIIGVRAEK